VRRLKVPEQVERAMGTFELVLERHVQARPKHQSTSHALKDETHLATEMLDEEADEEVFL